MTSTVSNTEERIVLARVHMTGESLGASVTLTIDEEFSWHLTVHGCTISIGSLSEVPPSLTSAAAVKTDQFC